MRTVKINNQEELVEVLSVLDSLDNGDFVLAEIDNNRGYAIFDLYYDSTTDKFGMFDKCEEVFESLDDMERHIIREYL